MRSTESDLTTRARIRDRAIEKFAEAGFSISVRAIAEAAGVSAGLVIHHFTSKEGLRLACDEHVLAQIYDARIDFVGGDESRGDFLTYLASVDDYSTVLGYVVRSLQAGGRVALQFVEHMIESGADYIDRAVAAGTIRPSSNPQARTRYLVGLSLGNLLLYATTHIKPGQAPDFATMIRELAAEQVEPSLELFTYGLFTDSRLLDDYRRFSLSGGKGDASGSSTDM